MSDLESIQSRLQPKGDCMVWSGCHDKDGYGFAKVRGRSVRVHRFVYECVHGPIPAGVVILHDCDEPGCARVDHLIAGTQTDNMRDCSRKCRLRPRGRQQLTCRVPRRGQSVTPKHPSRRVAIDPRNP